MRAFVGLIVAFVGLAVVVEGRARYGAINDAAGNERWYTDGYSYMHKFYVNVTFDFVDNPNPWDQASVNKGTGEVDIVAGTLMGVYYDQVDNFCSVSVASDTQAPEPVGAVFQTSPEVYQHYEKDEMFYYGLEFATDPSQAPPDDKTCRATIEALYHPLTAEAGATLQRLSRLYVEDSSPDYAKADNWGPVALITFVTNAAIGAVGVAAYMIMQRIQCTRADDLTARIL